VKISAIDPQRLRPLTWLERIWSAAGYLKAYLDQGITDATRAREIVPDPTALIRDSPSQIVQDRCLDRLATPRQADAGRRTSRGPTIVEELKQRRDSRRSTSPVTAPAALRAGRPSFRHLRRARRRSRAP